MSTKQKTCSVCNKKLGFLNHTFEGHKKICNKCFTSADIKISEMAERGPENITIGEIKKRISDIGSSDKGNTCDVCGNELTFLKTNKLADSKVCSDCLRPAKLSFKELKDLHNIKLSEIKPRINGDVDNFNPSKIINKTVQFNDSDKRMLIMPGEIIEYDKIVSYELLEDGDTIASGGLGRAALGGALFGGAGAVVGAVTGNRKGNCRKLQIKLTIDNAYKSATYITFIDKKVKKGSSEYETALNHAQECMSTLELILSHRNTDNETSKVSSADEIMKYKELLDIGAISAEEFETKKKELLDL